MMIFRSKLALIAVFVLLLSVPVMAQEDAPLPVTPERLALAKQYVATVPLKAQITKAIEQMSQQVPVEQRVLFKELGAKSIDTDKLAASAAQAVAEVFTDEEIKAMTVFYSSPEGQSVRSKMPLYDQKMQPAMAQAMKDFMVKLQENKVLPTGKIAP